MLYSPAAQTAINWMTDLQYLESTCSKKENVDVMPDLTLGKN